MVQKVHFFPFAGKTNPFFDHLLLRIIIKINKHLRYIFVKVILPARDILSVSSIHRIGNLQRTNNLLFKLKCAYYIKTSIFLIFIVCLVKGRFGFRSPIFAVFLLFFHAKLFGFLLHIITYLQYLLEFFDYFIS